MSEKKQIRVHGGDVLSYEKEYGKKPLDFSSNVSPLGIPDGVRQAVIDSLDHAEEYPDPQCRNLRQAIAAYHGVSPEWIFCGNGAADVIDRLAQALRPNRALITAPTFGEYAVALRRIGCKVKEHPLEAPTFRVTDDILNKITIDLDLLLLCEPNNPTGITTDHELMEQILIRCRQMHVWLVVDESFQEFLDDPKAYSMESHLGEFQQDADGTIRGGLMILHSFTKLYGMAGIRLGYCLCADQDLLKKMELAGQPWAVSIPAQAAGIAALQEGTYRTQLRQMIRSERERMKRELAACGCSSILGEANYLFFRHERTDLAERLKEHGILIRTCTDYTGLDGHWYRVAVRTPEENQVLLEHVSKLQNPHFHGE